MHNIFRFILFYRIAYDPFCSIEKKITTFDDVCTKTRRCKRRVYKGKTLSGQPNISIRYDEIWDMKFIHSTIFDDLAVFLLWYHAVKGLILVEWIICDANTLYFSMF